MTQLMHSFLGHVAPQELLNAVRQGEVAAICLFSHANVVSPMQLRELTMSIQNAAKEGGHLPLLIGIDQEGGQLIAVTGGATELPGNMALGATRSTELAEKAGYVLGRELLAMGVNLNFAPSVDVNVNPDNPVIGIRSFSDDPLIVSELSVALIKGMQDQGVIATAKHFPGHGDTSMDSHYDAPIVPHSRERLERVELAPFRAASAVGVGAMMTAHVRFPVLDKENPATLSRAILTDLLRNEIGFKGLIITDAMDMSAVTKIGEVESIKKSINSGVDLVLLGHLKDQLKFMHEVSNFDNSDSLQRIQAARMNIPDEMPPLSVVGCAEHQAIAQEIADQSITIVENNGLIPLDPSSVRRIAVINVKPMDLTPADTSSGVRIQLAEAIHRRHKNVIDVEIPYRANSDEIREVLAKTSSANIVIVGTLGADQDPGQAELIEALYDLGKDLIVVAMRTPYDIVAFPMVENYLCSYGIRPVSCEAIAKVLFGEIEATGILPCEIRF